jgi:2-polyprenyl-3-methyl-5-hydroxy-6-metoxy-1,4-benzoquinol methylase
MESSKMTTEMETLKSRLRATWIAGDFGEIASSFAGGAANFVNDLGIKPGDKVLDVACGTGNQSIPAAQLGAIVTGIDIAPNLIEQAKLNAENGGLKIRFEVGDAEKLPYEDASFDIVLSMFGAMFAPRPEFVVNELTRVCRPGGLIAMGNWTLEGFIGQMFKTTGKHVSPPAGMPSPILWGTEDAARERFAGVVSIQTVRRTIWFTFPFGTDDTVEFFRTYYGPTQKAFASLDENGQLALRKDLEALWAKHNTATDGTTKVESEYLEVRVIC